MRRSASGARARWERPWTTAFRAGKGSPTTVPEDDLIIEPFDLPCELFDPLLRAAGHTDPFERAREHEAGGQLTHLSRKHRLPAIEASRPRDLDVSKVTCLDTIGEPSHGQRRFRLILERAGVIVERLEVDVFDARLDVKSGGRTKRPVE